MVLGRKSSKRLLTASFGTDHLVRYHRLSGSTRIGRANKWVGGANRLRSDSGDRAPEPKAAKTAGASRGASSTEKPQWTDPAAARARAELLRVKAPPPAAPENIQEAEAAARAQIKVVREIQAMTDEELLAH